MEFKTVRVADIAEFPTELGNRCLLLLELGLNAYRNTEEELLDALTESALNPACLEICLKSSRCRGFFEAFEKGRTPFRERDPIRLLEYGGRHWAAEGKHRVCLAKRSGVETLEAVVHHLAEDTESLLPHEGEPGRYRFSFVLSLTPRGRLEAKGTMICLWAEGPPNMISGKFSFQGAWLDISRDTGGSLVEVFPGLQYRVLVQKGHKASLFRRRPATAVEAEVLIGADHPRAKIWLAEAPAGDILRLDASSFRTVYRRGCWRRRNLRQMCRMLPVVH